MDWKVYLDIAALLVGIVALTVSIYAIHDARKKAHDAILIERNRAWSRALSGMMWLCIDRTEKAHSPAVADATNECFQLFEAAEPGKWTPAKVKEAVENESLQAAAEMVSAGYARWKPEFLIEKGQQKLQLWKSDKNRVRIQRLLGTTKTFKLFC
jgi:hypothetical protein